MYYDHHGARCACRLGIAEYNIGQHVRTEASVGQQVRKKLAMVNTQNFGGFRGDNMGKKEPKTLNVWGSISN